MIKNIINYYPRAYVGNGGVTVAMWKYIEAYKKKYVNLYVAFDKNLHKEQSLVIKGVKKIKVKHHLFGGFRFPENFLKNFSEETILILHSGYLFHNMVAAFYAKNKKIKIVLIPHGAYHPNVIKKNFLLKKIFIFLESFVYKKLYLIQAYNSEDLKHLKKTFKKNKISVIPIPITIKKEKKKKNKLNKGKYFSYMGRYDIYTKGLDLLIKAYKEVPKDLRIPIILHGVDGKYGTKKDVIQLVKNENLDKIIKVKGAIYGNEKDNFLSKSFMGIFLSRNDGFPIAVMEHFAKNKPCLISKEATIWKMTKKNNLGLVTDLQIKSIKDIFCTILKNKTTFAKIYKPKKFIENNLNNNVINETFYKNFK